MWHGPFFSLLQDSERDEEQPVGLRPGAGSIIDARGVPASREVLNHGGTLTGAEAAARGPAPRPL